jgi:FtsP/CotA-like multicopper oxidase with cupredoxin domain
MIRRLAAMIGLPPTANISSQKRATSTAMKDHISRPSRRAVVAGLAAATVLKPGHPAHAEAPSPLTLRCAPDILELKDGGAATPVWSLGHDALRLARGDRPEIAIANDLPVPVALNWRGIDGVNAIEPLLARSPLAPSASDRFQLPLRHAGTYLCDLALLGDNAARPARALPVIVSENEPVQVDRDEALLIEGWRLKPDCVAITAGSDPEGTTPVYTVNGQLKYEIKARGRERLRLRFINALARHVIALKIERHDVMVMALDGEPAEPFLARNGAFALAPGGRADVFVDVAPGVGSAQILMHDGEAARPVAQLITLDQTPARAETLPAAAALPSNGLPIRLDLKGALRADLAIGGDQKDWLPPAAFAASAPPAFRTKAGRTVVLSLINHASTTSVFHLHGHHFRLLDRLDDGWKPFWLDTIAIDAGQTQRVAFAAEYAGRWLLEAAETKWSAPRLLRWYGVD